MELKSVYDHNMKPNSGQQLAENLRILLENNDINSNQLAQILNVPVMTIRRLLSGETTDPRISTLKLIADYFNISVDSLVDKLANIKSLKPSKSYFVPKLDWATAGNITAIDELDLAKWKEWQSISLREQDGISKMAFALESRPSMYPRFPQGTIFIIDPDVSPKDGDIVLIKLKQKGELTLRELSIDPPEWKLHSLATGSTALHYCENEHHIVGINLLTMLYNRTPHG